MNNPNSWFQFALYVGVLLAITKPLGVYLTRVLDPQAETFLDGNVNISLIFQQLAMKLQPQG